MTLSFWEAGVGCWLGHVCSLILPSLWGWKPPRCSRVLSPPSLLWPSVPAPSIPTGTKGCGSFCMRRICVTWAGGVPLICVAWGRGQEGKESHHPSFGALFLLTPSASHRGNIYFSFPRPHHCPKGSLVTRECQPLAAPALTLGPSRERRRLHKGGKREGEMWGLRCLG